MEDDPPIITTQRRRPGWRLAAALGAIAFVAGLAVMALALRYDDRWINAKTAAPTVTLPIAAGKTPVVIVPSTAAAPPLPAIDLDALSLREKELDARLANLEIRTASVGSDAQAASGYATRAEGLLVAFAARRAIDRGLTLGYVEDQLRVRFGAAEPRAVATIIQASRNPVTIEDLRGGLDAVAPELATGAASAGWLASVQRELGNLVVIHRTGTPSPLPVDRLTRARRMIEAGQVEAALAEVAHTPGAPAAQGWTNAARRYIAAREALDRIEQAALSNPPAPAPSPAPAPPISDMPGMGTTPPTP